MLTTALGVTPLACDRKLRRMEHRTATTSHETPVAPVTAVWPSQALACESASPTQGQKHEAAPAKRFPLATCRFGAPAHREAAATYKSRMKGPLLSGHQSNGAQHAEDDPDGHCRLPVAQVP